MRLYNAVFPIMVAKFLNVRSSAPARIHGGELLVSSCPGVARFYSGFTFDWLKCFSFEIGCTYSMKKYQRQQRIRQTGPLGRVSRWAGGYCMPMRREVSQVKMAANCFSIYLMRQSQSQRTRRCRRRRSRSRSRWTFCNLATYRNVGSKL